MPWLWDSSCFKPDPYRAPGIHPAPPNTPHKESSPLGWATGLAQAADRDSPARLSRLPKTFGSFDPPTSEFLKLPGIAASLLKPTVSLDVGIWGFGKQKLFPSIQNPSTQACCTRSTSSNFWRFWTFTLPTSSISCWRPGVRYG